VGSLSARELEGTLESFVPDSIGPGMFIVHCIYWPPKMHFVDHSCVLGRYCLDQHLTACVCHLCPTDSPPGPDTLVSVRLAIQV
jgi:hypothetical protein